MKYKGKGLKVLIYGELTSYTPRTHLKEATP